jgi:glycosyltransferase involved in cell wall biosynthesis
LACYAHSTYFNRELIVVDDGDVHPVDAATVEAIGARLVRVSPGTPIGTKLNRGLQEAHGTWCQKMDDDDWYGPGFLNSMIEAVSKQRINVCCPLVAFLMPFLFFEVARWEIRRSLVNNLPGATLLFAREDWQHAPFRRLSQDEDLWFVRDQTRWGAVVLPVRSPNSIDSFLAVRHRGLGKDRGHTWIQQVDGRSLEEYLHQERPLHRSPEELLPEWALGFYRDLRTELLASP